MDGLLSDRPDKVLGLIPEFRAGKNKEGYEFRETFYPTHRFGCD